MNTFRVSLNSQMSMSVHINSLCSSLTYQLHNISRIRRFLDYDTCHLVTCTLVLSRIDYGNGLLLGANKSDIQRLQCIQNWAAKLVCKSHKWDHATPCLRELHWLTVDKRITFKVFMTVFKCLNMIRHSEIWTIKKNDLKKLVAFEMSCYRKVLNITWKDKTRNEDVLLRISSFKFKPKRILARITESQLSWFGHVCRMSNMRLPKRILMEMVPGTNRQGRPRKRWEDDIIAGSTFLEAYRNAEDRNKWADFVHGANVLWDTVQR